MVVATSRGTGMASEQAQPQQRPAGTTLPVQPHDSAQLELISDLPADWLEQSDDSDRVDRSVADADLQLRLALHRYEGAEWEVFATELARYGIGVLSAWMHRGLIFNRCKAKNIGLTPLLRPFTKDEVDELAGETVAKALHHFRVDVLMKNRWTPTGGASLRTFFLGQCLLRFGNVYRAWRDHENEVFEGVVCDDGEVLELFSPHETGPDRRVISDLASSDLLSGVKNDRLRKAMWMTGEEFTQAEIAVELSCSVKSVERMLSHERRRLQERRSTG